MDWKIRYSFACVLVLDTSLTYSIFHWTHLRFPLVKNKDILTDCAQFHKFNFLHQKISPLIYYQPPPHAAAKRTIDGGVCAAFAFESSLKDSDGSWL